MLRSKKLIAAVGTLALLVAGCSGGAEPEGVEGATDAPAPSGGVAASAWAVQSSQSDSFVAAVDRWNADHPDKQIDLQVMPDNGYKDKVRVALGAGEAPTLIYGWGGGGLRDYVDQGWWNHSRPSRPMSTQKSSSATFLLRWAQPASTGRSMAFPSAICSLWSSSTTRRS